MNKPDYVYCVAIGFDKMYNDKSEKPDLEAWCGNKNINNEFYFIDVSHAALNVKRKGRLLICRQCANEIIKTIKNGQY